MHPAQASCAAQVGRQAGLYQPIALESLEVRLLLSAAPQPEQAMELFSTSPALFVQNQGQWPGAGVRYVHNGSGAPANAYRMAGTADFSRDGRVDVLWRNTANSSLCGWILGGAGGATRTGYSSFPSVPYATCPAATWRIAAVGDMNKDGKSDILWQDVAGNLRLWLMDGTRYSSALDLQIA